MWRPFRRKKPLAVPAPVIEPGIRIPTGGDYLDTLEACHLALTPNCYLEIGTRWGDSLQRARGFAIAIDPEFRLSQHAMDGVTEAHLFRATSDDFFASDALARLGRKVDFAFLDGLHLFEYLLRDFIGVERAAVPGAVVTMHDVVPLNTLMAERDWDFNKTQSWTGDVWKILPILRKYRPDLTVQVLDCAPTGLGLVHGLDPANDSLTRHYDAIIAEWLDVALDARWLAHLSEEFPLITPTTAVLVGRG